MKRNQELISVIIPTYRRTNTLKRALDSIVNQTYKNIEIIVVDDNAEFLDIRKENENLIKKYKNIKFIKNEKNLGGGLSRNEGIKHSNGTFLAFLDDDDEFLPQKIEQQYLLYKKLNNPNIGMIYCYAEMINVDGTSYLQKKRIEGVPLKEHINNCIAATSWWFCPKDKVLDVGGFEDISSRQDATLLMKMLLKKYEFYCVPEVLIKYYWHDSNNGISKVNLNSLNAEKKYMQIFINNSFNLLEDQRKSVEYLFLYRISLLMILLNLKKEAYINFKSMIKYKLFSKKNLKIFLGIIFNKTYCSLSKLKNKKKVGIK